MSWLHSEDEGHGLTRRALLAASAGVAGLAVAGPAAAASGFIVLESRSHATSSFEMDLAAGIVTRSGTHLGVTQPTITGSKSWPDTAVVSFP
jgi:hypothetical protein